MYRAELKARAKASIAKATPAASLVTLVYLLITNGINFVIKTDYNQFTKLFESSLEGSVEMADFIAATATTLKTFFLILFFKLLVTVIYAGYTKYVLQLSRNQPADISTLFDFIGRIPRFVGLDLLMGLIIFGATLIPIIFSVVLSIFISPIFVLLSFGALIPSLYFALVYSQAIFFAVDDPGMGIVDCLRESRKIMNGRKWEYFVLGLSFIPWFLLITITFGIASLWVTPYANVTYANYFNHLVDYHPPVEQETMPPQMD